jgi:hypothetical protein
VWCRIWGAESAVIPSCLALLPARAGDGPTFRFDDLRHVRIRLVEQFVKLRFGLLAPVPRVVKRTDLRLALVTLRRLEQQIVFALGIERRVQVHQVDRFGGNGIPEHVQVVAVVEVVHGLDFTKWQSDTVGGGGMAPKVIIFGTHSLCPVAYSRAGQNPVVISMDVFSYSAAQ